MDEPQVRAIFERLSGTETPPSQVDVGLARLNGRRKLRRRRAVMSGTPAVAVVVLAVSANALFPAAPHAPRGPHRSGHPAAGSPPPATAIFNPLVPYAEFGWLPAGVSLVAGTTGRFSQDLAAGPNAHRATWSLTVFSEGRCNLSSGQILRRLRRGGRPVLDCTMAPGDSYLLMPRRQAPSVNGHLAFWANHELVWEYTHDSWVIVRTGPQVHPGLIVKVAVGVRFGHLQQPALRFPIQLTGLPAAWRAGSVHFVPDAGVLRGNQLDLAGTGTRGIPQPTVDASLAGPGSSCYFYPGGQSRHRTINGIKVVVTRLSPATFQVCAVHAHGLFLFVSTYGNETPRAVSIFRDHLRILGADRSRWTASPLG